MSRETFLNDYIEKTKDLLTHIDREKVLKVVDMIMLMNLTRGQVFIIGNGGSAATANHFASDLNKLASPGNRHRTNAISLCESIPYITAIANDISYNSIFTEQLKNHMFRGHDILIGISCSGNSTNLVEAFKLAKSNGLYTISFTGCGGGTIKQLSDINIDIDDDNYPRIEDVHMLLCHSIASIIRRRKRFCVMLDRDGTLIRDMHYLNDKNKIEYLPGVMDGLKLLTSMGIRLFIVTNQSGLHRGLITEEQLEEITQKITNDFGNEHISIESVHCCPHTPEENCECRKPKAGVAKYIAFDGNVDMTKSFMIGDSDADVEMANAVGASAFKVKEGEFLTAVVSIIKIIEERGD